MKKFFVLFALLFAGCAEENGDILNKVNDCIKVGESLGLAASVSGSQCRLEYKEYGSSWSFNLSYVEGARHILDVEKQVKDHPRKMACVSACKAKLSKDKRKDRDELFKCHIQCEKKGSNG